MVDENIDPRTVDSVKKFSEYSEAAHKNMEGLRKQIREFNKVMNVSHTRTRDLRESLRQMQSIEPMRNVQNLPKFGDKILRKVVKIYQDSGNVSVKSSKIGKIEEI